MSDTQRGIRLFECVACGHVFQIRRAFCPKCGGTRLNETCAILDGRVVACTQVHTAPLGSPTGSVPFWIVLVDTVAGPRIMASSAKALDIGERIRTTSKDPTHGPYFAHVPDDDQT
ncbi:Zn-ribbon domain-containing OB-fold protein [Rhodalgimonas zhirmunskyi]|uniref:ChsH2 rubredoxin-like zinc ribbon domain-containing protein n=1 Tax=Rhodalgimonas zhirmunskyi TaxID=2964767 RepID=A0AAJ1U7R8_9RHOB|nr:hypothetical protein [Rhodoalgimonas zhirmunskyi]MDQ2095155.1 hypothetical protein [Rhodoalgimonas zhirmunskyi]